MPRGKSKSTPASPPQADLLAHRPAVGSINAGHDWERLLGVPSAHAILDGTAESSEPPCAHEWSRETDQFGQRRCVWCDALLTSDGTVID